MLAERLTAPCVGSRERGGGEGGRGGGGEGLSCLTHKSRWLGVAINRELLLSMLKGARSCYKQRVALIHAKGG